MQVWTVQNMSTGLEDNVRKHLAKLLRHQRRRRRDPHQNQYAPFPGGVGHNSGTKAVDCRPICPIYCRRVSDYNENMWLHMHVNVMVIMFAGSTGPCSFTPPGKVLKLPHSISLLFISCQSILPSFHMSLVLREPVFGASDHV